MKDIAIEKIPGGFSVDGLALKSGKCGCTSVLPCCYSWSKVRQRGNSFQFTAKLSGPDSQDVLYLELFGEKRMVPWSR